MPEKGKIKRVFPGGNTGYGFFSYYDYVLSQEEATRIMILKGGPGTGKSSFMKKIAEEMINRGFDVEFHHCSSDPASLDGIVIPAIKVALIDGTSPHIVDPKNPGAVDEIIHLGDFWNEDGFKNNKFNIINTNKEIKRLFTKAYKYTGSARLINEDIEAMNSENFDKYTANKIAEKLISDIIKNPKGNSLGKERHLFASAITPNGLIDHVETIVTPYSNLYYIKGEPGTGRSTLLKKVFEAAVQNGYYVEAYHCALEPEKFEHLVIPELDTALTASIRLMEKATSLINMDALRDKTLVEKYKDDMEYAKKLFNELIEQAIRTIQKSKKNHDELEKYYIPNMNFNRISELRTKIIDRVLKYAGLI